MQGLVTLTVHRGTHQLGCTVQAHLNELQIFGLDIHKTQARLASVSVNGLSLSRATSLPKHMNPKPYSDRAQIELSSPVPPNGEAKPDAAVAARLSRTKKAVKCRRLLTVGVAPIVNFDLERYIADLKLSREANEYVRDAVIAPSRNPSGYISHTIYYPCFKFGYAVGLESRDIEFGLGLMLIYREDVLGVYEQPPKRHAIAITETGQNIWLETTPDFLVLTTGGIEIWEGKPATKLATRQLRHPNRYQVVEGRYRSAAFEAHFEQMGFKYFIATEREIDPAFVRAARFLTPYFSGTSPVPITNEECDQLTTYIRCHAGAFLKDVPIGNASRRTELAFYLLARAQVFTSWSDADLENPDSLRLYPTVQDESAFHEFLEMSRPRPANLAELGYRLTPGVLIEISGNHYQLTKLSGERVYLTNSAQDERVLSFQELLDLRPRIGRIIGAEKTFELLYQEAPLEDRQTWAARKAAIMPYLPGAVLAKHAPRSRTVRKWRDAYVGHERNGKPGDEAIFPKFYKCGRKPRPFPPDVEAAFLRLVDEQFLKPKRGKVAWLYSALRGEIGADRTPNKRAIYRRCESCDHHKRDWKQLGKRLAMRSSPIFGDSPTFGSPNGHRSFFRAHIDSTPLDLSLPEEKRQYLCKMVDGYDGRILAHVISDAGPDAMTIRNVLIDCIARHGVMPCEITCDWGPEHQTVWLRKTLAHLNITLDYRAKGTPRQGEAVENAFSVCCAQLIHNLEGHTHLLKQARMVTQAVDPRQFAIWNSGELRKAIDEYCVLRNDLPSGENPSPNAIARACEDKFGPMPRQVPSAEEMAKLLLPLVKGGVRKVSQRGTVRHDGKTFGVIGPRNPLVRFAGQDVEIRWIPDNLDTIIAVLQRPRLCVTLRCVNCSGPSRDIVAQANIIDAKNEQCLLDAGEVSHPEDRKAKFVVGIIERERGMKRRSKVVAFPLGVAKAIDRTTKRVPTIPFN